MTTAPTPTVDLEGIDLDQPMPCGTNDAGVEPNHCPLPVAWIGRSTCGHSTLLCGEHHGKAVFLEGLGCVYDCTACNTHVIVTWAPV